MLKNLKITNGIFFSQRVLLELTAAGFSREEAYKGSTKKRNASMERKFFFLQ